MANMLGKGDSFGSKAHLRRSTNWKAPHSRELNNIFFNKGTFFSHFSNKAILLEPKLEHLSSLPNVTISTPTDNTSLCFDTQDSPSLQSSTNQSLDHNREVLSVQSDPNLDDGSLKSLESQESEDENPLDHSPSAENTETTDEPAVPLAETNDVTVSTPPSEKNQSFCLLERWNEQMEASTIKPGSKPDQEVVSHLELLRIQHKFGLSLSAVAAIKKWAHKSHLSHPPIYERKPATRKKQLKLIRQVLGISYDDGFKEIAIDWLPQNKKRPVHIRPFEDCLYELLTNQELIGEKGEHINLPHPSDPFKARPNIVPEHSTQLHHGWWWSETMDECCVEPDEILVPIIGYMDGVATDNNGRLPVTPFNITLGIFDTETRRKPEAWTTALLYPDDNSEASIQPGTKTVHKIQNLHNCISLALRDLKELMDSGRTVAWKIPYGPDGKMWKVRLRFAFAYIIGDTEMHDKLCGRYGPRTRGIKCICRHCNSATDLLSKGGLEFESNFMFTPAALDPDSHDSDYFKSISHHPIHNAFHGFYFGANKYNIHLATPGELLHMVQKGACTRVIDGIVNMWKDPSVKQDDVAAVLNTRNSNILLEEFDRLGKIYGEHLSRQSDRNRPRTKFRNSLFVKCKVSSVITIVLLELRTLISPTNSTEKRARTCWCTSLHPMCNGIRPRPTDI